MFKKIREWLANRNYYLSYATCYKEMENRGKAVFGCCDGVAGGDYNSGYLQYGCIQCPHLCLARESSGEK